MPSSQSNRSRLVKMAVRNLGCIGPEGIEVALDDIVCLVGPNNCGKSTTLRAYEAAVAGEKLKEGEIHANADGAPAEVELWVHIPEGAGNVHERWKEHRDGLLLVRSLWQWSGPGVPPVRRTWNPEAGETGAYVDDDKASGLDSVFKSRLPKPFRIGSLEDPSEEHERLLELVLEPIKTKLKALTEDENSSLALQIKKLQEEAERPVADFRAILDQVQDEVSKSYRKVFNGSAVRLTAALGPLPIDPAAALLKGSRIDIQEPHATTRWTQQGTGSQRALFWSMLKVRTELNRLAQEKQAHARDLAAKEKDLKTAQKKLVEQEQKLAAATKDKQRQDWESKVAATKAKIAELESAVSGSTTTAEAEQPFLPGYMLLIDEPETALHPSAVRAAKDHLYELAENDGWQVMLSTHHPAFVDPVKDHTTVVRLHRPDIHSPPNVYRADGITFSEDEKNNLKSLMAFDQSVAEMFFASRVIVVEGDTEFAAFTEVMDHDTEAFPVDGRPLILRARGKWIIPTLVRILAHFKMSFAVLHDIDAPRSQSGASRNSAYTANARISEAVAGARAKGSLVVHETSKPEFERQHGMKLPSKDKPYAAWKKVREDKAIRESVRAVLDRLVSVPDIDYESDTADGRHYEFHLQDWAKLHAPDDPAFDFSPIEELATS